MPKFEVEVYETRSVKCLYVVEASDEVVAIVAAEEGNTLSEREVGMAEVMHRTTYGVRPAQEAPADA